MNAPPTPGRPNLADLITAAAESIRDCPPELRPAAMERLRAQLGDSPKARLFFDSLRSALQRNGWLAEGEK